MVRPCMVVVGCVSGVPRIDCRVCLVVGCVRAGVHRNWTGGCDADAAVPTRGYDTHRAERRAVPQLVPQRRHLCVTGSRCPANAYVVPFVCTAPHNTLAMRPHAALTGLRVPLHVHMAAVVVCCLSDDGTSTLLCPVTLVRDACSISQTTLGTRSLPTSSPAPRPSIDGAVSSPRPGPLCRCCLRQSWTGGRPWSRR